MATPGKSNSSLASIMSAAGKVINSPPSSANAGKVNAFYLTCDKIEVKQIRDGLILVADCNRNEYNGDAPSTLELDGIIGFNTEGTALIWTEGKNFSQHIKAWALEDCRYLHVEVKQGGRKLDRFDLGLRIGNTGTKDPQLEYYADESRVSQTLIAGKKVSQPKGMTPWKQFDHSKTRVIESRPPPPPTVPSTPTTAPKPPTQPTAPQSPHASPPRQVERKAAPRVPPRKAILGCGEPIKDVYHGDTSEGRTLWCNHGFTFGGCSDGNCVHHHTKCELSAFEEEIRKVQRCHHGSKAGKCTWESCVFYVKGFNGTECCEHGCFPGFCRQNGCRWSCGTNGGKRPTLPAQPYGPCKHDCGPGGCHVDNCPYWRGIVLMSDGAVVTHKESNHIGDSLRDGNIEARSFSVASDIRCETDMAYNRCRIAYKTQVDDKIQLAEVECSQGYWSEPTEIDVYPDVVPGGRFALVYNPMDSDPSCNTNRGHAQDLNSWYIHDRFKRFLFFTEEDGDGYVMMQAYDAAQGLWLRPQKLRDQYGREMGIKAHRFSGFAATFAHGKHPMILLYFVDESNALLEYVGKPCESYEGFGYRWHRTMDIEEGIGLKGFISAVHYNEKTYVLFRNSSRQLVLATAYRRRFISDENGSRRGRRNDNRDGEADWQYDIIRDHKQISKNSPLALAVRPGKGPVVFYVRRDQSGRTETIYATEIESDIDPSNASDAGLEVVDDLHTRRIGKLEPSSNLGCASFPYGPATCGRWSTQHYARLFSVSKLDGDNILIERIQRKDLTPSSARSTGWVISGGVVNTDVEGLAARNHEFNYEWEVKYKVDIELDRRHLHPHSAAASKSDGHWHGGQGSLHIHGNASSTSVNSYGGSAGGHSHGGHTHGEHSHGESTHTAGGHVHVTGGAHTHAHQHSQGHVHSVPVLTH